MRLAEIQVPASRVRGVGPATAAQLETLGIRTAGDILSYWPRDWEDRTVRVPLARFADGQKINTLATVVAHDWFGFGRMKTLKLVIEDADGTRAELACFNRPFLAKSFPEGTEVAVHGHFQWKYGAIQSANFDIEPAAGAQERVIPVYALTAGLTQVQLRKIVRNAIAEYGRGIESELPERVRVERNLPSKQEIIRLMHEPASLADATRAREALIFEELFLFEYAVGQRSIARRGKLPDTGTEQTAQTRPSVQAKLRPLQARLAERLPFPLTADQEAAIGEINADLSSVSGAMSRLLQGDVGSGKTLVAFFACLAVIDSGGQCAFLAPTELLARQHAENAARILESAGIRLAFLTGNVKAGGRTKLLAELKAGNIDLVIGTHALFSSGVEYRNLRMVVIDEQHRFGVLQRSAIIEKGTSCNTDRQMPHVLMMSATPIPRTLALSAFGDMDVSVIRTMPPGRLPVITHLARQGNEEKVYDFIRRELSLGRQAYFVYPLIDRSDALSVKSAEEMYVTLRDRIFPGTAIALIHSQVPEDEQRAIMASFRSGETRVLVATSVVEVGVDVPNATCMVIEHAERFGLSALHQLRGRVGRGNLQSWCFLVYASNLSEDGKARLRVMHGTNDGFLIAEEDLRLRGPGDVSGIQQSGYVSFTLADPVRDYDILLEAREAAFSLLSVEQNLQ